MFDLRPTPVVLRLMIVLFAIWFTFAVLINFASMQSAASLVQEYLALKATHVIPGGFVWEPITYMWLHELQSPMHLLFNLLFLLFFGPPLERRWGGRAFLKFWVLAGIFAGFFSVLMGLLIPEWFGDHIVGASGSLMAALVAFGLVQPNSEVLMFFVLPMKAKNFIWIALGLDILFFFASNPTTSRVAVQTHIGGAIAGYLLVTGNWRPSLLRDKLRLKSIDAKRKRRAGRKGPKLEVLPGGRGDRDLLN